MTKISVIYKAFADCNTKLLSAISEFMDIEFNFFSECPQHVDYPLILLDASEEILRVARECGMPFIAYISRQSSSPKTTSDVADFSSSEFLPQVLRRQSMLTKEAKDLNEIRISDPCEVLAQVQGLPIWVVSSRHKNQYYTSVSLPDFENDNRLGEFFNGETFLRLLPLYCFLRFSVSRPLWEPPPMRACIIVDDPNLHWSTYGPINYRNLLGYCNKHNIHIAFATIPLDAWYVHPKTARIFRDNDRHLSLLIHGNNHAKGELARPKHQDEALHYFAQSLHRIKRMEVKSGLSVDCVMVPPHGLVNKATALVISQLGFESICTNRWSLWQHIKPWELSSNFGMEPAGFLANNMPVLNRFRMVSPICRNEIIIAALLGTPIIPYCHVEDFANSFSEIEETVLFINKLGQVCWLSISEILCSNYSWSKIDNILLVRAYSNKIKITTPNNTLWLQIEFPITKNDFEPNKTLTIRTSARNGQKKYICGDKIPVEPGQQYEISIINHLTYNIDMLRKPTYDYQSLLRRIGTELRDRFFIPNSLSMFAPNSLIRRNN